MLSVFHGDCLEVMRALKNQSIDAVITDPPYGLEFMGKEWDRFSGDVTDRDFKGFVLSQQRTRNVKCPDCDKWAYDHPGRLCECGGIRRAQGNTFQSWCEQWASECLRVLKPGGHLLAFGGTRTYHRLACAIEDAGFEIRDSLHWIYGSGFPKSLDVSKAIDKAARGVPQGGGDPTSPNHGRYKTQATEGSRSDGDRGQGYGAGPGQFMAEAGVKNDRDLVPEAQQWEGWGTALKPAHEPIVVARKPLTGTVASNVLQWGTGGLNIDGTRVGTTENLNGGAYAKNGNERYDGTENWRYKRQGDAGEFMQPEGRWPPNILLTHSADCEMTGTRKVKTGTSVERNRDGGIHNEVYGKYHKPPREDVTYGISGLEIVQAWDCADGCPVAEMNRQSGSLKSGSNNFINRSSADHLGNTSPAYGVESRPAGQQMISYGDTGGASRFFPQFMYCAKAAPRERPKVDGIAHPTCKPLALMRWLVRLITPPGGIVLDPFGGTGTTAEACICEGFRYVLIEREADYIKLIRFRLKKHLEQPSLFDSEEL